MRTSYSVYTGVTKIKSKTKQFANKLTFGIAAGVASIGLAIIPLASAATTTVVSPSNMDGWQKTEASFPATDPVGTIDFVPSSEADGVGAAQFITTADGSYTRLRHDYNLKLSELTTLSYKTKQISGNPSTADVNLRLYICTTGTDCADGYNDVLVFEPYYNNLAEHPIQTGVWQTWDGIAGYWWSNNPSTYSGLGGSGAGDYNTNFHLSDVFNQYQNATITSVGLGTGTTNFPWVVQADHLVVNDTTYNFEPAATTFQVKPWTYDPGKTRKVDAAWQTHQGLADAGNSNHALYLAKKTSTATNASAGATVAYSGGLSSLGFDYRNDGWCGAGAPRFNVYTTAGTYYFFGCTAGTHTAVNGNWTHVEFTNADAFPANGTTAWPGFGNVTVTGMDLVFDEGTDLATNPGYAYLDNIQVNGVVAGKPGLAQ